MSSAPSPLPPNIKSRLKASYDIVAPSYNAWTLKHTSTRLHYLSRLLGLLPSSPSQPVPALELGCGAGDPVTKQLAADGRFRVTSNDLSSTQLALARAAVPGPVEWREGDMMDLAFEEGSLGAVVGLYSLIHLPREEQRVLVGRVARWLAPGGLLLANFPGAGQESVVMEHWLHEDGWMFWSGWEPEETVKMVKEAGLEVLLEEKRQDPGDAGFLWIIARKP